MLARSEVFARYRVYLCCDIEKNDKVGGCSEEMFFDNHERSVFTLYQVSGDNKQKLWKIKRHSGTEVWQLGDLSGNDASNVGGGFSGVGGGFSDVGGGFTCIGGGFSNIGAKYSGVGGGGGMT
eukprot:277509_1